MPEQRLIFHCDCNNFFASCECLERPELKDVPMAVAGDPKERVGIVVAKNEIAKRYGVKTTDTVYQARKKCPNIVFVPPRHRLYSAVSKKVNAVYRQYTEFVEPASIDESYLDMTGVPEFYGMTPRELADSLRAHVREEVGVTISVGVSYNKIFAKMGSDYKKPDATTVITEENFHDILWPLPVSELMFVGKSCAQTLRKMGVLTIGALAGYDRGALTERLGKLGDQLWIFANGLDREEVRLFGAEREVKSISRGMTFRRDLVSADEVHTGLAVLVDEVATNLRRQKLVGAVVDVKIRRPDMHTISRQISLGHNTCLQHEILQVAEKLVHDHWPVGPDAPIRALTVGITHLTPADEATEQISLFDLAPGLETAGNLSVDGELSHDPASRAARPSREKQERLEAAVDSLRKKHGLDKITLGFMENKSIGVGHEREE